MKLSRLVAFILVAQLLAAPLTSGILVLCLGSDGHVAVESATSDICCREWETARRQASGEAQATIIEPASEPCCEDVELSVDSATLTVPIPKVVPASALPYSAALDDPPLSGGSAEPIPLPIESPIAASLRTVVLRD